MADVSVEFGAKDTGLEGTLKTIQDQLVALDGELKSGTLSFDEINRKMREAAQAEKLHQSLGGTKDQIEALGLSFKQTTPELEKFAEGQKGAAQETQKASTSFQTMAGEMFELKAALENGNLSADEFDKTLRRLNKLEDIKQKMDAFGKSTLGAGESADQASPEVEEIGTDIKKAGNEAEDFGEKSKGGFIKMSAAVAAGQLAAEAAMAGIKAAINLAKAAIDDFGAALDLGGRLDDLSIQTGIAAGELLVLERAFQNSGAGADKMSTTISKVASAIVDASNGSGTASAAFDKLGLSAQELINLPADKQFERIASALTGVSNETERSALASDIFGERLGKDLLPLISDFTGEVNKANGQLGSLPGIMNNSAQAFADIGDNIKVVQGKFVEFASGILAAMTPALKAITEGLSRIDAAGLGEKLANAFLGGTKAMEGFQSAVDAFKIGEFGKAFELIFESIKLQLMQTGNAVITNFTAAFSTAAEVIRALFSPESATMKFIDTSFFILGQKAAMTFGNAMLSIIPNIRMFDGIRENLEQNLQRMEDAQYNNFKRFKEFGADAAKEVGTVMSQIPDVFNQKLTESESKFFDIGEQSAKVKGLQDEIAAAVANTNKEKQNGIDMAPVEQGNAAALLAEEQKRLANELATSAAKADAAEKTFSQIENEIELNNAIATGNQEEIKRVQEKQKAADIAAQIKANEESIPAIIEDIIAKTGTSAETARDLAEQLVESKNAALGISATASNATTNFNSAAKAVKSVKEAIDAADKAKMDNPPRSMNERLTESQERLSAMKDFIGEDLNNMHLLDIMKKLGLSAPALMSTDEKLKMVENAVKKLEEADPAEITPTVDEVGVNDKLEAVKDYLAKIEKPDATPEVDKDKAVDSAKTAMDAIKSQLKSVPAEIELDAEKAVGKIRKSLAKEIDLSLSSSEGTKHLSNIDKLVDLIKGFVEKIEGKLPLQALAY